MTTNHIASIEEIIAALTQGEMVIMVDDEDRENEGDLIMVADHVTAQAINFMATHGRGLICLTITPKRCEQLALPLMVQDNRASLATNFTVSIEAAQGVSTGISTQDRAHTIATAVAAEAKPKDLVQPGHIFPLKAQSGGVLVRAGHTEAGCDLAQLAGFEPATVICEILAEDGSMARLPALIKFAQVHNLKIGTIADLIEYRVSNDRLIERISQQTVTNHWGQFELHGYRDTLSGDTHMALVHGTIDSNQTTVVRVHNGLSVLDFLHDQRCHPAMAFSHAMDLLTQHTQGVMIILHQAESNTDLATRLQHTTESAQPHKWDPRLNGIGAQMLRDLGVRKMQLIGSPQRIPSMAGYGLEIVGFLNAEPPAASDR